MAQEGHDDDGLKKAFAVLAHHTAKHLEEQDARHIGFSFKSPFYSYNLVGALGVNIIIYMWL
jgi:hypothetical protein